MSSTNMDIGLIFSFRNPPQWRVPFPEFYAEQFRQLPLAAELRKNPERLIGSPTISTPEDVGSELERFTLR